MRCSPNPYCSCDRLMFQRIRGGPWVCINCDLPPAVTVLPPARPPHHK